jgi:hypothetical protein
MTLSEAQRDAEIRAKVTNMLPDGLLAEFSGEEIRIDATRPWQISEMATAPSAEGPQASVTDRPLGVRPLGPSTLLFPEHVGPLALEDHGDRLSAARQIAHHMGLELPEVLAELDQIEEIVYGIADWKTRGCTSRVIFRYAQRHDIGLLPARI